MKVTVSAPGKIHLLGEHAVVYGKPALLTAINRRLTVTIVPGDNKTVIHTSEPSDYINHILAIISNHYKLSQLPPLQISIRSEILSGYHLGSSAAVAVAMVGALLYFLKKIWNPTLINQLAFEAEKKAHGNPSGGDNTVCTFGGFIWYRRELEFLKSMWQLPMKLSHKLNNFYLINTGKPKETTGEMVAYVKSKIKTQNSKLKKLFEEN